MNRRAYFLERAALALSLLSLIACGKKVQVDDSCDSGFYSADECSTSLHWPDGTKIPFEFNGSVPATIRPAVVRASLEYNNVLARTSISLDVASSHAPNFNATPGSVSGDGINGIYWLEEPWPWPNEPDTDAMTVVVFNHARITEADIFLRADSFAKRNMLVSENLESIDSASDSGDINVKWSYLLSLHEFGHALGRVHTRDATSIMQASVGLNLLATGLSEFDIETLGKVYALRPNALTFR